MTYEITKIEKGLIDDDFLHKRVTLKVFMDSDYWLSCKLYEDGRLLGFYISNEKFSINSKDIMLEKLVEYELDPQTVKEIKSLL